MKNSSLEVSYVILFLISRRQGFSESVSVSMTTIAIWDLIKCIAGVMERFSGILYIWDPVSAYSWTNIGTVVFNYLVCFSSYVTSVLAAYVAVERCLCVSVPLKVKWLLTPRVTMTACVVISVGVFSFFAVIFGIYDIVWVWSDTFNATVPCGCLWKERFLYRAPGSTFPLLQSLGNPLASGFIRRHRGCYGHHHLQIKTGVEVQSLSNRNIRRTDLDFQSTKLFISTPKTGPTKTTTKSFQLRSSGGEDAPYHHSDLHRELVAQDCPLHCQMCYLRLLFSEALPLFVRVCRPLGVSRRLCQRSCQLFCLLRHELVIPINISSYDLSAISA